jgi:hypothetical protein
VRLDELGDGGWWHLTTSGRAEAIGSIRACDVDGLEKLVPFVALGASREPFREFLGSGVTTPEPTSWWRTK